MGIGHRLACAGIAALIAALAVSCSDGAEPERDALQRPEMASETTVAPAFTPAERVQARRQVEWVQVPDHLKHTMVARRGSDGKLAIECVHGHPIRLDDIGPIQPATTPGGATR